MIALAWRAAPRLPIRRWVADVARRAALDLGFRSGELAVAIVDDAEMTRLHAQFLDIAETTDVLTFDLGCDRRRGLLDAQIVICADEARRVAGPSRAAIGAELALYVLHGVLHLAGYDDAAPAAARRMAARQRQLLDRLGIATAVPPPGAASRRP